MQRSYTRFMNAAERTARHYGSVKNFVHPFLALAVILTASCGTQPGYIEPPLQSQPATISGTHYNLADVLSPDLTLAVVAIDGQMLGRDWRSWDQPVAVTPGDHQVEFGECLCGPFTDKAADYIAVEVSLSAGRHYVLTGTLPRGPNLNALGWIADSKGNAVSKKIPIFLYTKPILGPRSTFFIPIFVH